MLKRAPSGFCLLAAAVVFSGCIETTLVSFDITTDLPCSEAGSVSITVGIEGQTEKAVPSKTVKSCNKEGNVTAIGTYAVTPKPGKSPVASIKVALATGSLDVETDCTPAKGYAGCIVSRRRISFVPRRTLRVPIDMLLICKGVQCDENTTCSKTGRCVSSLIDVEKCDGDTCAGLVTVASEGIGCFNEGASSPLFCNGDNSWCTRGPSGQRACAGQPLPGGQSYQCRSAKDCGPNLQCIVGEGSVLGTCAVMPTANDTVLCSFGEPVTPCADGPFACSVDAGFGRTTCASGDAGTGIDRDGGLACPRTGALTCYQPTPYCQTISGTPTCVADGGAQCWYPSDCPTGQACYAGVQGRFFNACLPAPTRDNPVKLCNERNGDADCPTGYACDGQFYGFRACRNLNPPFVMCPPGADAGLRCADGTPYCQQNEDAGYACSANQGGGTRSWNCTSEQNCQIGEKCVYRRSMDRDGGLISYCANPPTDAGVPVVCERASECSGGRNCGPARGEDGLSLCSNPAPSCDRDYFTDNMCSVGGNCCFIPNVAFVCEPSRASCVDSDAGTGGIPLECYTSAQCQPGQICVHVNGGPTVPNAGYICTEVPRDGGRIFIRSVQCQPETEHLDCLPEYPNCTLNTNTRTYYCSAPDGGGTNRYLPN